MYRSIMLSAAAALSLSFIGCSSSSDNATKSIAFSEVSVPDNTAAKATVTAASSATVNGTEQSIDFHTIIRTGQQMTSGTFGQMIDHTGAALKEADGSAMICSNGSGPDHTSLLTHGDTLYAVTQFECSIGGAYVTKLSQDENGLLSAVDTKPADFSAARGTYVNCAGMTSPWGTHLGTEEYEPQMATWDDAKKGLSNSWHDGHLSSIAQYFGKERTALSDAEVKNLGYYYGWNWELKITGDNMESEVTKHYAMGRAAWEQAYVLPDNRTAYMGDDGTNGAFFMFVADKAKDLSAGTLYMAKWNQTSSDDAGSADLTWISLGHATNSQIDNAIAAGLTFDHMFEQEAYNDGCSAGFTSIHEQTGPRCVKLKSGNFYGTPIATIASRAEARIYGAMLGGTTEFRKEEGVTFNAKDKKLYLAMSQVAKGMEDGSSQDTGGNNDIRLSKNSCGAVYELNVKGSVKDSSGSAIDSDYVAVDIDALVVGKPDVDYTGTIYEGNSCDIEGIANPDNVAFLEGYNTLLIGEDTDMHPNDFLWSYNLESGELTRILTAPYGAETTSPFWHKNFGGYGYITTVIQHPFGEVDGDDPDYSIGASASDSDKESYIGYVGPLPKL